MSANPTADSSRGDEWLWGWDPTPGIVSVHAVATGTAHVWRRDTLTGALHHDEVPFRPWLLLASIDDLRREIGDRLVPEARDVDPRAITWRELRGDGALRFLVRSRDARNITTAVLRGASRRLGRTVTRLSELGDGNFLALPLEEQYLVATGRTHFRDLPFSALHRLQFDLETTGLDPAVDRIFLVAVRDSRGFEDVLEVTRADDDDAEAALIARLAAVLRKVDPDSIENHNLHGFDLPFLVRRARALGVTLDLGRLAGQPLRTRAAARGATASPDDPDPSRGAEPARRVRYTVPGRELIDTMDAVRRYDFASRDLPGHGLKALARHFGIASPTREYVPGAQVYDVWRRDPERVRRYALDDVREVDALATLLGGAAYALARMAPRRYERLADAGPATGVIDPLLVRAYLRDGTALPAREAGDGTVHTGAALYLFASGVAQRIVKADVASLYPSLMREYRIGPRRDVLGAMLALVDRLVEHRLAAKARARAAAPGTAERHADEALSAAMKILVNSAYGYLAATTLTRFSDVHAANEVTRRGREVLGLLCRELAARGVTLLEADTDGAYVAVPETWTEADERRIVAEVGALLPPLVRLEFDGRYRAMLSHEPKNYALLHYDETLVMRGVAFRSSRAEPFGERFLRDALHALLRGDVPGVRNAYVSTYVALRRRAVATADVTARVRLTKTPEQYLAVRARRRELTYEALLGAGIDTWSIGSRVRVYRRQGGRAGLWPETDESATDTAGVDPHDYDVAYYQRVLRESFASRLARAFTPDVFALIVADPEQPSLFETSLEGVLPQLTVQMAPPESAP